MDTQTVSTTRTQTTDQTTPISTDTNTTSTNDNTTQDIHLIDIPQTSTPTNNQAQSDFINTAHNEEIDMADFPDQTDSSSFTHPPPVASSAAPSSIATIPPQSYDNFLFLPENTCSSNQPELTLAVTNQIAPYTETSERTTTNENAPTISNTTAPTDLFAQIALLIQTNNESLVSKLSSELKSEIKQNSNSIHDKLSSEIQGINLKLQQTQDSIKSFTESIEAKMLDLSINQQLIERDIKEIKIEQEHQYNRIDNLKSNLNVELTKQINDVKREVIKGLTDHHNDVKIQLDQNKDTIMENVNYKINACTTQCESAIENSQQHLMKTLNTNVMQQNAKFEALEERINNSPVTANNTPIFVTCPNNGPNSYDSQPPKFNGRMLNPQEFLRKLKKYYQASVTNKKPSDKVEHLHDVIEFCLDHHAARWYALIKNEVETWNDFEAAFNSKFWSYEIQRSIRQRVEAEQYRANGPLTRTEYATERILLLRSIKPPLTDEEIINILAQHFSELTQDAIRVQNITTITAFQNLLQREDVQTHHTRPNRHPTSPRQDNSGHQRRQSPPRQPYRNQYDGRNQQPQYPRNNQYSQGHHRPDYRSHPYHSRGNNYNNYRPDYQNRNNHQHENRSNNNQDRRNQPPERTYPTREQNQVCSTIIERSSNSPSTSPNPTTQTLNC